MTEAIGAQKGERVEGLGYEIEREAHKLERRHSLKESKGSCRKSATRRFAFPVCPWRISRSSMPTRLFLPSVPTKCAIEVPSKHLANLARLREEENRHFRHSATPT
ncbi:MAG TPA: hypothetical protein VFH31_08695 [Pyrinomonadaceae bacterium]|nr:hypothetical protein [Pyrinomonadaceae bacterium]